MLKRLLNLLTPNQVADSIDSPTSPEPQTSQKKTRKKSAKKSQHTDSGSLNVLSRDQHSISRKNISHSAIKVMKTLNQADFEAYLVGGSIRDSLLGNSPKDFDVATNATPEQVRKLFRNSRIIGRRFRIVHVRFGREIIEVTTFRGQDNDSSQQVESNTGQLLRDNVYGDMRSDALRRDFTINALYYSVKDFSIYDYTRGIEDLEQRQLRMIGDPLTRYTEDPVRLLRVIRFAAKLGFNIEENTASPIKDNASLLSTVPAARLFDEILKLLLNGSATATYTLLKDYGLLTPLFPQTMSVLDQDPYFEPLIHAVMVNTDKRIRSDKRVTPAFIYGALLWPAFIHHQRQLVSEGIPELAAMHQAMDAVIGPQLSVITIPKRFLIPMRQIWELQWRLAQRFGKRAEKTLNHEKFRAGYDFLLMREAAGEALDGLGQWWTIYQDASDDEQEKMLADLKPQGNKGNGRKRNRRRKKPTTQSDSHNNESTNQKPDQHSD